MIPPAVGDAAEYVKCGGAAEDQQAALADAGTRRSAGGGTCSASGPSTVNDVDHAAFIEDYGAAIEAGQASLLIGAGLSAGAGYPEWAGLLEPIADEFEIPTTVNLPLQVQYIEQKPGGRERIVEHLVTTIGAVTPTPLENHFLLAHLGIGDKAFESEEASPTY